MYINIYIYKKICLDNKNFIILNFFDLYVLFCIITININYSVY